MIQLTLSIDTNSNKAQAFIKIKDENDTKKFSLSHEQIQMLEERKQKHLDKESKSFNWPEIKEGLINSVK